MSPMIRTYLDLDEYVQQINKLEYDLNIKNANTHNFEIVLETSKSKNIIYTLKCQKCNMFAFKVNNQKIIICDTTDNIVCLTCDESTIKNIIE